MKIRCGIELANLTDVGLERENNEDYYGYWESDSDEEFQRKGRLAIIADGMGGHQGGEEASHLAVEAVRQAYRESAADPQHALLAAFQSAHQQIRQSAGEHAELSGMGTTCTAIALTDGQLCYAHIGDSRLYLLRNGDLRRMTSDHSRVAQLLEAGILQPEEAEDHPDRHFLCKAMGVHDEFEPEISPEPIPLQPGDLLLLCTDGLWSLLSDQEILQALQSLSPSDACKELVRRARERGAPDNITLQVLKLNSNARNKTRVS